MSGPGITVESTARSQAEAVRRRDISARELLELHLARIGERNRELNAIVSLDEERARAGAAAADEHLARGGRSDRCTGCRSPSRTPTPSPAGARPTAHRSTPTTCPTPTTWSSSGSAHAGVVLVGKTNVPEFAAGSHTFNRGLRHHPATRSTRPGRPAGPAAVRPARWPRAWCRSPRAATWAAACATRRRSAGSSGSGPSLGRVPTWPAANQWETTSVGGPMARTVGDVALLLSVIAGPDPRVPLALGDPGAAFASAARRHARRAAGRLHRRPRRRPDGRPPGRGGARDRRAG